MFEVPGSEIVGVQVTDEYVKGESGPVYIRNTSTSTTSPSVDEEDLNTSIRLKQ